MNIRNKGFTLIELLAVILILGIIALIAIPTVSNIIEQSKKGAFETTASNLVSAVEDACQLQQLKGETITDTYTFSNGLVLPSLNIKGSLPKNGTATVDSNCNVTISVTNGKYTASKQYNDDTVIVIDNDEILNPNPVYANGTAVYFNPETGAKCTVGEAVSTTGTKTGCMKWYAFNDGGTSVNTINLLLDHNTNALEPWNTSASNTSGPNEVLIQLKYDTSSWNGVPTRTDSYSVSNGTANYTIDYSTYKARLITASEIAMITGNSLFFEVSAPSTDWFYFDSNNQTQTATTIGSSNYAWLFDYTSGCTSYGCNIDDASNYGYWTSTAVYGDSINAWRVRRSGYLIYDNVNNTGNNGVRPVITILKSSL